MRFGTCSWIVNFISPAEGGLLFQTSSNNPRLVFVPTGCFLFLVAFEHFDLEDMNNMEPFTKDWCRMTTILRSIQDYSWETNGGNSQLGWVNWSLQHVKSILTLNLQLIVSVEDVMMPDFYVFWDCGGLGCKFICDIGSCTDLTVCC